MKTGFRLFLTFFLLCLTGCHTPSPLINYTQIQNLSLASIVQKHPDWKPSDLQLVSVKSEMSADGSQMIEVSYKRPASTEYTKDTARFGQKTEISTKTVFVRMSNSGKIQDIGEGRSVSFQ
jgi:hypothetical protein